MIKIRIQATQEDLEWLQKQLVTVPTIQITEVSKPFSNIGTNRYFRQYMEIEKRDEATKK